MKLVIDIPEETYRVLKNIYKNITGGLVVPESVANGTPLPKGHGRLIDADALFDKFEEVGWYNNADRDEVAEKILLDAPIVIEADKEGEE